MRLFSPSRYSVLMRVDTPEGAEKFKHLQNIGWHEYIYEQEVFSKARVWPKYHKFVVFVDSEEVEEVYHVLVLDDNEHLDVLSDGRRLDDGHIFTGEPRSFIRLVRDGEVQAVLVTNDSPFDLNMETDDYQAKMVTVADLVNSVLIEKGLEPTATPENMIVVSQL